MNYVIHELSGSSHALGNLWYRLKDSCISLNALPAALPSKNVFKVHPYIQTFFSLALVKSVSVLQ